tara:strand:- start:149 stop:1003 length:855 start_codon:yes stop_codon:yes gene_type:complete
MIKPMLAHKYNPEKADYPAYIQPKLDGVRCVFTKNGAYSRTGKEFMNVDHIKNELKPVFKKYPNLVLDGELYNHELKDDFEKIISLVRKTKPTQEHRDEAEKLVQYHIYDTISSMNFTYEKRLNKIIEIIAESTYSGLFLDSEILQLSLTAYVNNFEEATKYHQKFLEDGYEGSIYRNINGIYKGTRSWDLMKFKDFHDAEATIINYEVGKGKREGTLGKFIMQDGDGNIFGCPPGKGYNYEEMKNMLENIHKYIGQVATFTYFQRTQAGSYRHPLYKCIRNYE